MPDVGFAAYSALPADAAAADVSVISLRGFSLDLTALFDRARR